LKLLFDENLSPTLPRELADLYPDSGHVLALGLGGATDGAVWARAIADGFVLVTKDEDFQRLSVLRGAPPKVIWVRLGNCATADVIRLLRFRSEQIIAFVDSSSADFLALG
jgi:predicted nuclease of predicted toxin-antitoxin system